MRPVVALALVALAACDAASKTPEARSSAPPISDAKSAFVLATLRVDPLDATIVRRQVDGQDVANDADLERRFHEVREQALRDGKGVVELTVDGDATIPWDQIVHVVDVAKRCGIDKFHFAAGAPPKKPEPETPKSSEVAMPQENLYAIPAKSLDGSDGNLAQYKGKVALVVNVASECGFTKQYAGLEQLWKDYKDKGLVVLGFPSNEFGGQEPGDAATIRSFCTKNFGVTFPLMAKCEVKKGAGQSPVYQYLVGATGSEPNWNFCKYLVGKDGKALKFWKSPMTPESPELRGAIDAALAAK